MKLYHVMCRSAGVITRGQLLGALPLEIWRVKNVRNSVRFRTTFDFDCEYVCTGERYRQAVNSVINRNLFCVKQKKIR